jgi:hypothetical protein
MFHFPRGNYGVRFLYIVDLLNKHILVPRMMWVWVVTVLVVIGPVAGMLLQTIMIMLGVMSILWRGFYAATKLIFINSTTNLYATWH